jgi:cobalt-zinc-cadmium efflux system protein
MNGRTTRSCAGEPGSVATQEHAHHDHSSDHSHGGDHAGHGHHGHHHHAPKNFDRAFAIGTALNLGFVVAELGAGLYANSVALLADAVHNLSDVLALLLSWAAAWLARRPPTPRHTYGWGRFSILAALANAIMLLIGIGAIAWEAVQRFGAPEATDSKVVMWVGGIGIVINAATAAMFLRGRDEDLNIHAAFLHMAADAAVSLGVVIAALLIGLTGWLWLDPATSLLIAIAIAIGTWDLLRQSTGLALDRMPPAIYPDRVKARLLALPGVTEVHDLHVWPLSTTETALTAHLVCATDANHGLLQLATEAVDKDFSVRHATFQLETAADAELCRLRPSHIV